MSDARWEIGITIGAIAALAIALHFRMGNAATPAASLALKPEPAPGIPDYNIGNDVPGGVDFGPLNFSFPLTVLQQIIEFPIKLTNLMLPPLTAPNIKIPAPVLPLNVSNGTPQCGCSNAAMDFASATQNMYAAALNAWKSLQTNQYQPNINVNVVDIPHETQVYGLIVQRAPSNVADFGAAGGRIASPLL